MCPTWSILELLEPCWLKEPEHKRHWATNRPSLMLVRAQHKNDICDEMCLNFTQSWGRLVTLALSTLIRTRGRLNIKMLSYQYRDPHVKDKTVLRPSYILHGNPIPRKDGLYIETWPNIQASLGWLLVTLRCTPVAMELHTYQVMKEKIRIREKPIFFVDNSSIFTTAYSLKKELLIRLEILVPYILQYIPRNMHTVFALLCFVVVIHWLIFPYPSGLLHWHCGNLTIAPVPAKQPWRIWINTSCEFIMNNCITTTRQSTTKPCAYFLGYTVWQDVSIYYVSTTTKATPVEVGCHLANGGIREQRYPTCS